MDDPKLRDILTSGADIPGRPRPGQVGRHDIEQPNGQAAYPAYQLEVTWPEAQALRARLGLPPKAALRQPQRRCRRGGPSA